MHVLFMNNLSAAAILTACCLVPANASTDAVELCSSEIPLKSFVEQATKNRSPRYVRRYAYAELAGYLYAKTPTGSGFCGYSSENIVFLLRQATHPDSSKGYDTFEQFTLSEVRSIFQEAFGKGLLGLPKNARLAKCWADVPKLNVFKCEELELKVYCKIILGHRPTGFEVLRKYPKHYFQRC